MALKYVGYRNPSNTDAINSKERTGEKVEADSFVEDNTIVRGIEGFSVKLDSLNILARSIFIDLAKDCVRAGIDPVTKVGDMCRSTRQIVESVARAGLADFTLDQNKHYEATSTWIDPNWKPSGI